MKRIIIFVLICFSVVYIYSQNTISVKTPQKKVKLTSFNNQNSDISTNIPRNPTKNNRYALIIGNSNYEENGSDMVNIKFAINDAQLFKLYAINTLGVPDTKTNIYYIENAKAMDLKKYIDNFSQLIKNQVADCEFFVYYSGHGTLNSVNESMLVPVDVTSSYIESFGIKLSEIYEKFTPSNGKKVFFFLDACFSGGGKNGQLLVNAKDGVRRTPKNETAKTNLIVFAASSEDQISQEYLEKNHGLFTFFLLKNLQESQGNISYGELAELIINDVMNTTLNPANNFKVQKPNVNVNPSIEKEWENWRVVK